LPVPLCDGHDFDRRFVSEAPEGLALFLLVERVSASAGGIVRTRFLRGGSLAGRMYFLAAAAAASRLAAAAASVPFLVAAPF